MKPHEIVENALAIAQEYRREHGMTLTLRQMYYQFVARALVPNGQRTYKRIGAALTSARYAGAFPVEWLEDRGRTVHQGRVMGDSTDVESALAAAADELRRASDLWLHRSRWFGQPVHVSVWVEKEALSGVFERPCNRLGVSWFACKGYPSVSALDAWLDQVERTHVLGSVEDAVVLYFGDHDPDGFEIPRSAERNIAKLRSNREYSDLGIRFERIALSLDQIHRYSPPPFPAKMTSARYKSYVDEHGINDAWELDALNPNVLRDLITENVNEYFDESIHASNERIVAARREEMRERMEAVDVYNILKGA